MRSVWNLKKLTKPIINVRVNNTDESQLKWELIYKTKNIDAEINNNFDLTAVIVLNA